MDHHFGGNKTANGILIHHFRVNQTGEFTLQFRIQKLSSIDFQAGDMSPENIDAIVKLIVNKDDITNLWRTTHSYCDLVSPMQQGVSPKSSNENTKF